MKTVWSKENIKRILANEKYVGDVIYQKTFRTDCISKHTKINRGERTKYLVSNNHPAIVDRDLFNAVQAELARRSSKRRTSDKTLGVLDSMVSELYGMYRQMQTLKSGVVGSGKPVMRRDFPMDCLRSLLWKTGMSVRL